MPAHPSACVFSTLESKSQSKSLTWILDFDLGQVTEALCVLVWSSESCMCKMLIFCASSWTYFFLCRNMNPRDDFFFFNLFSYFLSLGQCYTHILHVYFQSLSGCFAPIGSFSRRSHSVCRTEVLSFASLFKQNSCWVLILAATAFVTQEFTAFLSFGCECFSFFYGKNSELFSSLWKIIVQPERLFFIETFSHWNSSWGFCAQFCTSCDIMRRSNHWTTAHLMVPQSPTPGPCRICWL